MEKTLLEYLHMKEEPVGVFLGNVDAVCDLDASPEKRNCVVPLLMAAAQGKTISMDEKSCNCPGGATGCCFGDGFARGNPQIHYMLAQGLGERALPQMPEHMKSGERFFCNEELGYKWRMQVPYSDKGYPRVVLAPMSRWDEIGEPDLVFIFANPDQISALVTLLGSHNGNLLNVIAPFGSACQSIVYAADQIGKEEPKAIMGLFDISQRRAALAGLLSLTMPYAMFEEIGKDLEISCFTTRAWKEIEKRL
ncbi:MAG: DUF169 domain-containing protein [Lachnospiraceae bacterium]|nr:DUF169 domain-containing protein [Lachnospiraceae bacterium]